jgi:hypothetical protein
MARRRDQGSGLSATSPAPVRQVGVESVPGQGTWQPARVRTLTVGQVRVLAVSGALSDAVGDVAAAIRYALAAGLPCVACDLSRVMALGEPGALRGLAANGKHSRDWPGIAIALAGLSPPASDTVIGMPMGRHLALTRTLAAALRHLESLPDPRVSSQRLTPRATAPRASRDFVSRTLLDWRLPQRIPAACLVVSELVTRAMIHSCSDIGVDIAESHGALRLSVRDSAAGRPEGPVCSDRGTEHHAVGVVTALCATSGVLTSADGGRSVWAVLDATPD